VAVVGFDDIPLSAYIRPSLTTVHQPFFEMGQRAAELLLSLVNTPTSAAPAPQNVSTHIQLTTSLTVRESCGARAAHHFSLPVPEIH
jgi:LacI family transcriptional regulator